VILVTLLGFGIL